MNRTFALIAAAAIVIAAAVLFAAGMLTQGNDQGDPDDADIMAEYRVEASDGTYRTVFELNGTPASESLVGMLPFSAEVKDYGSNEKIFDPPGALSEAVGLERDCPAGSIAYFSPWGNVALYSGSAPAYPGLYYMGYASEGADQIGSLSGTVRFRLL